MLDTVEGREIRQIDPPSPWVVRHAVLFPRDGRVLDLACGTGRHVRWLSGQGFAVLAVDVDAAALSGLQAMRGVETACHDLEQGAWPLGEDCFAGIVVSRYLHRPLLPLIARALMPGGVLIYETFMQGNARYGRPSRDDFLLAPGELPAFATRQGLEILASQEGYVDQPRPAMMQSICARRAAC